MRIYLSCLQSPLRHPIPAYGFWETYFKRGIEEAGSSWLETPDVDWAEGLTFTSGLVSRAHPGLDAWRERTWSAAVAHIRREHARRPIDMFLGYLYPQQVEPAAIAEIRELGIPCVNFFCDNVRQFRSIPSEYAPFDLHWVPEHKALPLYRRAGLETINLPMPTWVDPAHRNCRPVERHGPTFIGSHDDQREALFARAIELGAPVTLRGPGWAGVAPARRESTVPPTARSVGSVVRHQVEFMRSQGAVALARRVASRIGARVARDGRPPSYARHVEEAVFGQAYVDVTQQSAVTLGVNRYPSFRFPAARPDTYSRLRDIEAPMLGACYLTEWTEGLDELYDLESEIATYRSAEEMVAKLGELGADPARRARMRCSAQARALSCHGVPRSLASLASRLGISPAPVAG